jgi:ribosomal protein S18 acetylase RimI-like enzyme
VSSNLEIAIATREDIPGIVELQERNLPHNGGRLSVRLSSEWFEAAIVDMPILVARSHGRVVGYVVSTPLAAQANIPIVQAMLRVYPGASGAYIYGPICVAEDHRGRGIADALFDGLRKRLRGREGFTFIRRDNAMSLKVHTRMGMREVAEFSHDGVALVVVAYVG